MSKSRKLAAGLATLTLFDIAVAAADPVVRTPAPIIDWAGFYIGGHAGYRWAETNFSSPGYIFDPGSGNIGFPARNETLHPNGGIFGLQAGVNFMLSAAILAGLEGDWSWGRGRQTVAVAYTGVDANNDGFAFRRNSEIELSWQATIRGRLGVVSGAWLFYGTAGVALTNVKWSDSSMLITPFDGTFIAAWTGSKTLTGVAAGFGVEHMWTSNWIARIEYLYESFGSFNVLHGIGPQTGTVDLNEVHKLRIAISYKLGRP